MQVNATELRRRRILAGYSMKELAAAAGVSHVTVIELEHGRRSAQGATLRKLAAALGCSVGDLLHADELAPPIAAPDPA